MSLTLDDILFSTAVIYLAMMLFGFIWVWKSRIGTMSSEWRILNTLAVVSTCCAIVATILATQFQRVSSKDACKWLVRSTGPIGFLSVGLTRIFFVIRLSMIAPDAWRILMKSVLAIMSVATCTALFVFAYYSYFSFDPDFKVCVQVRKDHPLKTLLFMVYLLRNLFCTLGFIRVLGKSIQAARMSSVASASTIGSLRKDPMGRLVLITVICSITSTILNITMALFQSAAVHPTIKFRTGVLAICLEVTTTLLPPIALRLWKAISNAPLTTGTHKEATASVRGGTQSHVTPRI